MMNPISLLILVLSINTCIAADNAAQLAASYDSEFIVVFLNDFANDFDKYSSYLVANTLDLPQSVLQYYYDIATNTDYSFTTDLATLFPFSDFETFITVFPWYTSMLEDVSISTFYKPLDLTLTSVYDEVSDIVKTKKTVITFGSATESLSGTIASSSAVSAISASVSSFVSSASSSSAFSNSVTSESSSIGTSETSSASASTTSSSSSAAANTLITSFLSPFIFFLIFF